MVLIRPAQAADAAGIADVHVRAIREVCSKSYAAHQIEAWVSGKCPELYLDAIATKPFFVAVLNDDVVGFAQLNPEAGEVKAVYVRPDCVGRGVGRLLLQTLEDAARVRALTLLKVQASLNAVEFYRAQGYVLEDVTSYRLKVGAELECANMHKDFPPSSRPPCRVSQGLGTSGRDGI